MYYSAASRKKKKIEVVITAATCGAFVLLLLVGAFVYRLRKVGKLRHEVFVDVEGIFSFSGFAYFYNLMKNRFFFVCICSE